MGTFVQGEIPPFEQCELTDTGQVCIREVSDHSLDSWTATEMCPAGNVPDRRLNLEKDFLATISTVNQHILRKEIFPSN